MTRRLPPLNALRAFEAAARCGNFTRAAQELFVTQGAVSRHAIRWLIPRLARFHAQHPEIDVQITTSHQRADFEREDTDVSIHSEPIPPQGPGYRRLFGETLVPVCAPGLLQQGPPLRKPADLARHVLLCSMNRPHDWPAWLKAAGVKGVDGNAGLKFENAALAYQAAADKLGVIVALLPFVRDDLAAGKLVAPFDLCVPTQGAYYLAYPVRQEQPARVAAFEQWIALEALAADGAPPAGTGH